MTKGNTTNGVSIEGDINININNVIKNGKKIDKEMINDVGERVKDTAGTIIKNIANKCEEAINYVKEEVGK